MKYNHDKNTKTKECAPVIIPTLCRYEHLYKCIESLRKCSWSEYTEVYIGLDFPCKKAHIDGYNKIKRYLSNDFPEFKKINVFIREKNFGPSKNVKSILDIVRGKYDRYIYAEDDIEFSPNFLQYMNKMLEMFFDDDDVIAVTGYSYPVNWKAVPDSNVVKTNFVASTWGIGRWFKKMDSVNKYLNDGGLYQNFSKALINGKFDNLTNWAIKDYVGITNGAFNGSNYTKATDIAMRIYCGIENKYVIMPLVSKTRNNGFDGSGINTVSINDGDNCFDCISRNYLFSSQPIDQDDKFEPTLDYGFNLQENKELLNRFDFIDEVEVSELMMKAEKYSNYSRLYIFLLNLKANIRHLLGETYRFIKSCIDNIYIWCAGSVHIK